MDKPKSNHNRNNIKSITRYGIVATVAVTTLLRAEPIRAQAVYTATPITWQQQQSSWASFGGVPDIVAWQYPEGRAQLMAARKIAEHPAQYKETENSIHKWGSVWLGLGAFVLGAKIWLGLAKCWRTSPEEQALYDYVKFSEGLLERKWIRKEMKKDERYMGLKKAADDEFDANWDKLILPVLLAAGAVRAYCSGVFK